MKNGNDFLNAAGRSVTIRQIHEGDKLYEMAESFFIAEEGHTKPEELRELLFGSKTQHSSPKLWVAASKGEIIGMVLTFDFFQATYVSSLIVAKEKQGQGYGKRLLEQVCHDPNRTYVLLSEVAMSDSDRLAECVRRKIFYLRNGFRSVPIKWSSETYYKYDVHTKGPDLEMGSLLAALRKGREIWNTAQVGLLTQQGFS